MKAKFFILSLVVIAWLVYFTLARQTAPKLRVIQYTESYTLSDATSIIDRDAPNSFKIAYYGDYIMYEVMSPVKYSMMPQKTMSDTAKFELVAAKDTTYLYYTCQKNSSKGLCYVSPSDMHPKPFLLDSLRKALYIDSASLKPFGDELNPPVKTFRNKKTNKLEMEYSLGQKKNNHGNDTIIRYYNEKLSDIPFSFSPRIDKEKGTKLTKMNFITLTSEKGSDVICCRIDDVTKIEEIKPKQPQKFIALFKRFIQQKRVD